MRSSPIRALRRRGSIPVVVLTAAVSMVFVQVAAFAQVGPASCERVVTESITLTGDVTCDGEDFWLEVDGDDLVIDLNGFTVDVDGGREGVRILGRRNVTIRNGSIEGYAFDGVNSGRGIYVDGGSDVLVEGIVLTGADDVRAYGLDALGVDGLTLLDVTSTGHYYENAVAFETSNVTIRDSTFNGSQQSDGLLIEGNRSPLTLRDVVASENFGDGVDLRDVHGATTVRGLVAEDNGQRGLRAEGSRRTASLTIRDSAVNGNGDGGLGIRRFGSVVMRDTVADANGNRGAEIERVDVVNVWDGSFTDNDWTGLVIDDDFDSENLASVTLRRNVASGNYNGFDVQDFATLTALDNVASDNREDGFEISGDKRGRVRLERNRAEGNHDHGFHVQNVLRGTISKNRAIDNGLVDGGHGFNLVYLNGVSVERNVALGNDLNGFRSYRVTDSTFSRNRAAGNGERGFWVSDTYRTVFVGNVAEGNVDSGFHTTDAAGYNADLTFHKNLARDNGVHGYHLHQVDRTLTVVGNRAIGNGYNVDYDGFDLRDTASLVVRKNRAERNAGEGFAFLAIDGANTVVAGNAAIRNGSWGFFNGDEELIGQGNTVKGNGAPCYYVRCRGRGNTVTP